MPMSAPISPVRRSQRWAKKANNTLKTGVAGKDPMAARKALMQLKMAKKAQM